MIGEEDELFKVKNIFIYNVLFQGFKMACSRKYIQAAEKTMDGQDAYAGLQKEYQDGTAAQLALDDLETDLLELRLDAKWTKPLQVFLDTWSHKVLDMENIQDTGVPDKTKRKWLTSALKHHGEL